MSLEKRQFGLWPSPVSPRMLAEGLRLSSVAWDTDGEALVWLEGRSGKGVIVVQEPGAGAPRDLTSELDVRAEVGYGGGDLTVHDGVVYFVARGEGRLYRQPIAGGSAEPVTPACGKAASPRVTSDGRYLAYIHRDEHDVDRIAVVDAEGKKWPAILTEGHDFYSLPRWSPDGRTFAWIAWDHPNMPWDGTYLYVASVEQSPGGLPRLLAPQVVFGGPDIAVSQAEFTAQGDELVIVSDETGWSHVGVVSLATKELRRLTAGEIEYSAPQWAQGLFTIAVSGDGRSVYAIRSERGFKEIERIDLTSGKRDGEHALGGYSDFEGLVAAPVRDRLAVVASSPATSPRVVRCDAESESAVVVARATGETVAPDSLAVPSAISWRTEGGETAHGLLYRPASTRFTGSGRPPLVVLVHGGPNSQARARWDPEVQFLATRGYAVLQVNYRGSAGYGREYMMRLRGNWGVFDVADAVSGMRHVVESGEADPDRTVIMGGSAGGYTVLRTMIDAPEAFSAGVCRYGVSNLFALASDTHKFEERYLDSLVGQLPENAPLYRARSPEFQADRIRRPMAIFQGEDDKVVPKEQSDTIVAALKRNDVPHVYHVYPGEGHGWRKSETIEHYWTEVDRFLAHHVVFS